jgi:hypothetical protein
MSDVNGNERLHSIQIIPGVEEDSHHTAARTSSLPERICHSRPPVDDDGLSCLSKWQVCVHGCDMAKNYRQEST